MKRFFDMILKYWAIISFVLVIATTIFWNVISWGYDLDNQVILLTTNVDKMQGEVIVVSDVKQNVKELTNTTSTLKTEIGAIKKSQEQTAGDVNELKTSTSNLNVEINSIKKSQERTEDQIRETNELLRSMLLQQKQPEQRKQEPQIIYMMPPQQQQQQEQQQRYYQTNPRGYRYGPN